MVKGKGNSSRPQARHTRRLGPSQFEEHCFWEQVVVEKDCCLAAGGRRWRTANEH
jgi:hypothetical protein